MSLYGICFQHEYSKQDLNVDSLLIKDTMFKLFRKPTKVLLILLILLFIVYLFKNNDNQSAESAHFNYLTRDYVFLEESRKEVYTQRNIINTRRNKVNVYKPTADGYFKRHVQKVYLKTLKGKTPIFVHSRKDDNMISAYVRDFGTWEEDLLNQTAEFILRHPGTTFLDIGCNIGVYSLFVAKLGVKVISVDPVVSNLKLLSLSSVAANFTQNVTLVLNALSDEYKTVSLDIPRDNIGGAHIVSEIKRDSSFNVVAAETILLDDIIPYIKSGEVFIKMDAEGHEWNILRGSHNLFQNKNVKAILMEWVHYRHQQNGKYIVEYLIKNGLLPYSDVSMKRILDPASYYTWPENIFWIKR